MNVSLNGKTALGILGGVAGAILVGFGIEELIDAISKNDKNGLDKQGFDWGGFDRQGYNRAGYNRLGFDPEGFDKHGFAADGYDRSGFDQGGYGFPCDLFRVSVPPLLTAACRTELHFFLARNLV